MEETYIVKVTNAGTEVIPFDKDNSYQQIKDAVGGYIECAPFAVKTRENYTIDCFVDEEGLLKGLHANLRLCHLTGQYLVGNGVFVAHDAQGETVGLSKTDADAIKGSLC